MAGALPAGWNVGHSRRRNRPQKKHRAQQARAIAKGAGISDLDNDRRGGQAGGQVEKSPPRTPLHEIDARGSQAQNSHIRDGHARGLGQTHLLSAAAEVEALAGNGIGGEDEQARHGGQVRLTSLTAEEAASAGSVISGESNEQS